MPSWDSAQYLRFDRERTQPAVDLAARIRLEQPRRIIDLGCGPGNSTAVLARRWPDADVTGLDSSAEMIAAAAASHPGGKWLTGDIATFRDTEPLDLVFSNAALQWVADHARVLPHWFEQLSAGGALAFQVPANFNADGHRLIREVAASPGWRSVFSRAVREWHTEEPSFYYDVLARLAAHIDLWVTEYLHVLSGPGDIVEWYRGTGLRPWLDALPDDDARQRFCADYLAAVTQAFPRQIDGRVLFPFRRLFLVAYR